MGKLLTLEGISYIVLFTSVIPVFITMLLRVFCYHAEAFIGSIISLVFGIISVIFVIVVVQISPMFENPIGFRAILPIFILFLILIKNMDKSILEYDPISKRAWVVFLSLIYFALISSMMIA